MGLATRVSAVFLSAFILSACNCANNQLVGTNTELTVSPTELDFGKLKPGASLALPVEVRVTGRSAVSITDLRFEQDQRSAFSTTATPFTVAAGGAFQLQLIYTAPTALGLDTATLFLTSDTGAELTVALQGISAEDGTTTCVPRTCGSSCGPTEDGCGNTLDCPPCSTNPPDAGTPDSGTPDAGTTCAKRSCSDAAATCGSVSDGCGGNLNCGTCTNGAQCTANACVCAQGTTEVCDDNVDNNCDGNVDCADPQCSGLSSCAQQPCSITDTEVQLTTTYGAMPAIAFTGSSYGVFYLDDSMRYGFARLDSNFSIAQAAATTSITTPAHRPFPVFNGTQFGMGWSDVRNGALQYSNEVYFNRFDAQNGTALAAADLGISTGPGMAFPGSTGWSPALNEYGVLYADEGSSNTGGTQRRLYLQRVSPAGARLGTPQMVSPGSLTNATADFGALAWGGSNWGAAWSESRNGSALQIYFRRLDQTGAPEPTETLVSAGADLGFQPRIAVNGSSFGVLYSDQRGSAPVKNGIYFQRFDATGTGSSPARLVAATNAFAYADLVWTGSHWAVVFDDTRQGMRRLYSVKLDVDGNRVGADQLLSCQTLPTWAPTVAFDGSKLAVAFSYVQNGVHTVWAKRFSP